MRQAPLLLLLSNLDLEERDEQRARCRRRLLPGTGPGPARDARLGARVRRDRDQARGLRVGRAGGDALAHPAAGVEDRPVLAGLLRPAMARAERPGHPGRVRGTVLGRCRDRAVARRHRPGGGGGERQRDARADGRVAAADVRGRRRRQARRLLRVRARRGQRRRGHPDQGRLPRGHRRVGAERRQVLGHQRRHRQRARRRRLGRPGAGQPGPGHLHRPAGDARPVPGAEDPQARDQGLAYRRGGARRRARARPLPGRRQGAVRRPPGQDQGRRQHRRAGRAEDLRGDAAERRGDGRRASPARPTSTRATTRSAGSSSAARSARPRPSRSCSPT